MKAIYRNLLLFILLLIAISSIMLFFYAENFNFFTALTYTFGVFILLIASESTAKRMEEKE